jgi:hypothetical protein
LQDPFAFKFLSPHTIQPAWMMTMSWAESSKPSLRGPKPCTGWDLNVIPCQKAEHLGNLPCISLQCRVRCRRQ